MKLVRVDIRNFRLLRDASIRLDGDAATTILVGPNNSGKTSVAEALLLFTEGSAKKFSIYDVSVCCWELYGKAQATMMEESGLDHAMLVLPKMSLDLHFEYGEDSADLAVAADLLMDIDASYYGVTLRIECAVGDIAKLAREFKEQRRPDETLFAFLSTRMADYYDLSLFKVSQAGDEQELLEDAKILDRLIRVDFVYAQRHIDDQEQSRATRLSHLLHAHYEKHYRTTEPQDHRQIEDSLGAYATTLGNQYMKAFEGLITSLKKFGYPQRRAPSMRIKAELNATTLFHDNTRIWYGPEVLTESVGAATTGEEGSDAPATPAHDTPSPLYELPEKYNGLGFKNLIYMVLQIQSFRTAVAQIPIDRPRVHVIFIEEPETHLHPQVQSVFISQLSAFLSTDDLGAASQVILTTHSSHLVANCGFAPIRYFRRKGSEVDIRDLRLFESKLETADAVRFLTKYLSQVRCDLFFADKAILVEGQVERLLLPHMIAECAGRGCKELASEYISIMEVGGTHAHKFRGLLAFLEIPTLVITDLDAVDADGKACRVSSGVRTSNSTLRTWIPAKTDLRDILTTVPAEKVEGCIRIAHQIPEVSGVPCARTFEEAFLYCNATWLVAHHGSLPTTGEMLAALAVDGVMAKAFDMRLPKVDFALDLMVADGWKTPLYIEEGLAWLATYQVLP